MDLRQLNALLAVADQGSFTAAADALATVQSNVSAHIARLEREVGSVLVDRSTGQLTEEGEAVAARAGLELLLPLPGTSFRDELDQAARPRGITLTPRAELDGVRLIASLTFDGYGPAILPATAVPEYLRQEWRLVQVSGIPRRRIGVAQRSRGLPSAPARALLAILHDVVTEADNTPDELHVVPDLLPGR